MPAGDESADRGRDCLVFYAADKKEWAEWIASHLKDAGCRVVISSWELPQGASAQFFKMQSLPNPPPIFAVTSRRYPVSGSDLRNLESHLPSPILTGQFIPVKVDRFPARGILSQIQPLDLYAQPHSEARDKLLAIALRRPGPLRHFDFEEEFLLNALASRSTRVRSLPYPGDVLHGPRTFLRSFSIYLLVILIAFLLSLARRAAGGSTSQPGVAHAVVAISIAAMSIAAIGVGYLAIGHPDWPASRIRQQKAAISRTAGMLAVKTARAVNAFLRKHTSAVLHRMAVIARAVIESLGLTPPSTPSDDAVYAEIERRWTGIVHDLYARLPASEQVPTSTRPRDPM